MAETEKTAEYKLVEDKLSELSPLFDRMDTDESLYLLSPYTMKTLDGTKDMPDVANVTLNDPLQYANKAIAIIGGALKQPVVEGKDLSGKQSHIIEHFLDDFHFNVDEWLSKRGIPSLDSFINEQICIRGGIPARVCIRMDSETGTIIPDVLPLDRRWFAYELDDKGFVWAAPMYKRSKTAIKNTYGKDITEPMGEITDWWDKGKNIIHVNGEYVKTQTHIYGKPPFILSLCPIGSMLSTTSAVEHQGESIYWGNRGLYKEKNRTATILQTLNIMALFTNMQYESMKGEQANKPNQSPYGVRKVLPIEKGGGYKPMPIADIKNATRLFYSILEASLQKGSLTALDYGNLTFPLSAVAITALTSSRDDIFLPRIQAIAIFYQWLDKMVIEQCIALDSDIVLSSRDGKENRYKKADLVGDYTIKYRFYTISKEQMTADLTIASAAVNFLSPSTIRKEVLNLQDPEGEEARWESWQAEQADEVLFLYRRACSLIENNQPLEAFILARRCVAAIKQRQMQNTLTQTMASKPSGNGNGGGRAAIEAPPQVRGKEMMPLLSAAKGGGGQKQRSTLMEQPTEPTEETEVER